ncbi:MAG TPA: hypothetical protein VHZ97_23545 [Pseudonocardiaceae bacterium]|jgi:hypothetical protein|nr:hypothetical protein [Pseudonocardiaceae bacterium]
METPGRLGRTLLLGTVIIVASAVAGCTTTVVGSAEAAGPGPSSSHSTGAPSTSTPSVPPKVPGWQVVVADKAGVAYDVPPDWKVQSPDAIVGYEDAQGNPGASMNYAAIYKEGYCTGHSGSFRGETGITSTSTADPGQAASALAQQWATGSYSDGTVTPNVTPGAPQPITVAGTNGMVVKDTLTMTQQNPCDPPAGEVYAVALPLAAPNTGCDVMIVMADQGTSDAAPDQELQQIINSLRLTS